MHIYAYWALRLTNRLFLSLYFFKGATTWDWDHSWTYVCRSGSFPFGCRYEQQGLVLHVLWQRYSNEPCSKFMKIVEIQSCYAIWQQRYYVRVVAKGGFDHRSYSYHAFMNLFTYCNHWLLTVSESGRVHNTNFISLTKQMILITRKGMWKSVITAN